MLVRLFDIENGQPVPTEHCYTISALKFLMDTYATQYLKMYAYLQYMTCPSPEFNPFFNVPEDIREERILEYLKADFSSETDGLPEAVKVCRNLYETPTSRAYEGIKVMLDNLAKYMKSPITAGRDGNGPFLIKAAEKYPELRSSFKLAYSDLKEEQSDTTRGGAGKAYDQ